MMCSTGQGFLTHSVSVSSFLFLKVLSSVSCRDPGLEITNKHQLSSFQTIKKTNFLGEIVKHRNFNFVSKIHLAWAEKFLAIYERHEKMKEI